MSPSTKTGITLREKCPYLEIFWSVFSGIRTEYGEILRIFPNSLRMPENADKKNSEYEHFSRCVNYIKIIFKWSNLK